MIRQLVISRDNLHQLKSSGKRRVLSELVLITRHRLPKMRTDFSFEIAMVVPYEILAENRDFKYKIAELACTKIDLDQYD